MVLPICAHFAIIMPINVIYLGVYVTRYRIIKAAWCRTFVKTCSTADFHALLLNHYPPPNRHNGLLHALCIGRKQFKYIRAYLVIVTIIVYMTIHSLFFLS